MAHKIDLLLNCGCIAIEELEAAIFIPNAGEKRICSKHQQAAEIKRVGQPFWVDDRNEKEPIKEKEKK